MAFCSGMDLGIIKGNSRIVLPEGWRVGTLGNVTKIAGGTTPSTKNPEYWDGTVHWTSPKDLSNYKEMFLLTTEKKITTEGLKKISSGLLPTGTLLLSSRAPVGYLSLTTFKLAINQGYIAIFPEQYFSNCYMYLWLNLNMKTIENSANGSTFLEISKSSFRNIDCIVPDENVIKKFDEITTPIFDKILSNLIQIQTLKQTRDTLLSF
jgi:type I restriction enzyme S subunit